MNKLKNPETAKRFELELKNKFEVLSEPEDIQTNEEIFTKNLIECANKVIGKKRGTKREQWISEETWEMIDRRKEMKKIRDSANSVQTKETSKIEYQRMDKLVKKKCKRDKSRWFEEKIKEAEKAAQKNDTKTLYRIIKDITGTQSNTNVPIQDKKGKILGTEEEQNKRWVEHFKEVLNQPDPPTTFDFSNFELRPLLKVTLGKISKKEVRKAIKALKNNKAAGIDLIFAELLKYGGEEIVNRLTYMFNLIWEQEIVPDNWTKGVVVKLPKKGNLANCNNWRGITLLSVPGKAFCSILIQRLQNELDTTLREEQAGFRPKRSCCDQIFTLRNIIEQAREYNFPLALNFIDFKKAFDSIHRESLWAIARAYGIPPKYINIFKALYNNSRCCIKTQSGNTDFFCIITGVRQGCILSSLLFLLVVDFVLQQSMNETHFGIPWKDKNLTDLDFADDIAMISTSLQHLQEMTTKLQEAAAKVGLRISSTKTKIMHALQQNIQKIQIDDDELEEVEVKLKEVKHFKYLGS